MAYIVKLDAKAYKVPGICWHCGKTKAPLNPIRLDKMLWIPGNIFGQERTILAPLCDDHRAPNLLWRYVRIAAFPLSILCFFVLMFSTPLEAILPKPYSALAALTISVTCYITAQVILSKKQTFWLYHFNIKTLAVCFNNSERADAIKDDLDRTQHDGKV